MDLYIILLILKFNSYSTDNLNIATSKYFIITLLNLHSFGCYMCHEYRAPFQELLNTSMVLYTMGCNKYTFRCLRITQKVYCSHDVYYTLTGVYRYTPFLTVYGSQEIEWWDNNLKISQLRIGQKAADRLVTPFKE